MVYLNNFVVVVKCNGEILREKDGFVSLPFMSEYSLLIKNLNSRKVSVKVNIDGKDVLDNQSIIIGSNLETEIEGFLKGTIAKNKFKFIQKTKQIQNHRGDRIDDGIIRVEFAFEKENHYEHYKPYYSHRSFPLINDVKFCNTNDVQFQSTSSLNSIQSNVKQSIPIFDEGITVKGSEINQNFNYGNIGELESSQIIILKLRGEKSNGAFIQNSVTVKTKFICPSCGKKSKSHAKFCDMCGTFLE